MPYINKEIEGQIITTVRQATEIERVMLLGDADQELTVLELLDGRIIAAIDRDNRAATLATLATDGQEGMVFSHE